MKTRNLRAYNFEESFLGLIKMILSRSFSMSDYLEDNW